MPLDPLIGAALIQGGAGLINNMFNQQSVSSANEAAARNQQAANLMNREIAREQMAFQERMSNSAYQRAMDDMRKAGLNPMLAFSKGGASTPSGATATMGAAQPRATEFQNPLSNVAATALDYKTKQQSMAQVEKQIAISDANSKAEIALKAAQVAQTTQTAKNAAIQAEILRGQAAKSGLEGEFWKSDAGKSFYILDKINQAAGGSLDTLNSAKDLILPWKGAKQILRKGQGIHKDGTKFNLDTGEIVP